MTSPTTRTALLSAATCVFAAVSVHSIVYNQSRPGDPEAAETPVQIAERQVSSAPLVSREPNLSAIEEHTRRALEDIKRLAPQGPVDDSAFGGTVSAAAPPPTRAAEMPPAMAPVKEPMPELEAPADLSSATSVTEGDGPGTDAADAAAPVASLRPAARPIALIRSSVPVPESEPAPDAIRPSADPPALPSTASTGPERHDARDGALATDLLPSHGPHEWTGSGARKIVGIFETGSRRWALVQDATDQIQIVEEGDRIGAGMISEIRDGALTITVGPSFMTYATGDAF